MTLKQLMLKLFCLQDVSEKYNDLVDLVSRGKETYGERLAGTAAMDNWLLCREKQKVKDMFPPTEEVRHLKGLYHVLQGLGCVENRGHVC